MTDDWRIRILVGHEEHAGGLMERLGIGIGGEAAELAKDLESKRLAVSREDDVVFVYASSPDDAAKAQAVIETDREPRPLGIQYDSPDRLILLDRAPAIEAVCPVDRTGGDDAGEPGLPRLLEDLNGNRG